MKIRLDYILISGVSTNCYLLINEDSSDAVLIDPAGDASEIKKMLERNKCRLRAVLLTHGHYDHIGAAERIKDEYGVKVYAGEQEKELLADPYMNLSGHMDRENITLSADEWLSDGQHISPAGFDILAIHTPGHTEGGMSYYVEEAGILFSGDTLFEGSVGRTDFATGSFSKIVSSIKGKLFKLPDDTKVFPGHGDCTTIADEKKYNPFCQ